MNTAKDAALAILKTLLLVYPPLSDLIAKAVDAADDDDLLADDVAQILPEGGNSRRAQRILEGRVKPG